MTLNRTRTGQASLLLAAALDTGYSGISVTFGDMEPLPGVNELLNPEDEITVEVIGYRRDCGTEGEQTRVALLADVKAVQAWQAERQITLAAEGAQLQEGAYALIELGVRNSAGDGFAVSRAAGRRGKTALIKITALSFSSQGAGEEPSAPCALVALPAGPWDRVRVLDQVSGMKATSEDLLP